MKKQKRKHKSKYLLLNKSGDNFLCHAQYHSKVKIHINLAKPHQHNGKQLANPSGLIFNSYPAQPPAPPLLCINHQTIDQKKKSAESTSCTMLFCMCSCCPSIYIKCSLRLKITQNMKIVSSLETVGGLYMFLLKLTVMYWL